MTELSNRLVESRKKAGFRSAASAAAKMEMGYSTYSAHENGSKNPSTENLTRYASRFKVSLDWLMTGRDSAKTTCRLVPVSYAAEAGNWYVAKSQIPQYNEDVGIPDRQEYRDDELFAILVRGDSSDKINKDGDILVSIKLDNPELKNNKRYIVQRTRGNGQFEITVKRARADTVGEMWLLQETNNPLHMTPLKLSESDIIDITILGEVIWNISME